RPDRDSERGERFLQQRELREQFRLHPLACLITGPQLIPERLDDVIGCDRQVRGDAVEEREDRSDDAAYGGDFAPVLRFRRRQRVIVSKEFVRAVDEIHIHSVSSRRRYRSVVPSRTWVCKKHRPSSGITPRSRPDTCESSTARITSIRRSVSC